MSTRATGARKRCQRAAVCQLPLLAAGERRRDDADARHARPGHLHAARCGIRPARGRAGSRHSSIDDGTAPRPTMAADARLLAGAALADALRDARATTLARTMDQDDDAWNVAQQSGVNLPAWELGHLAWFAEFWILRGPHRAGADGFVTAAKPPSIAGPDAIFDSARLAHGDRWRVALPSRDELAKRLAAPARRLHRRHPARCETTTRTTSTASRSSTRTCMARRSPGCARRSAGRRRRAWPCLRCRRASRCASTAAPVALGRALDERGLRVRQRAAGDAGAPRAVRDRCDAAEECGVRRLRRGWRLRRRDALARSGRRLARAPGELASLALAPRRLRRLADALVRSLAAARCRGAGHPRLGVGSRGVLPLGRPSPAARGGVGARRRATRASAGAAASGNGPPTRSCPTRASSPDPTPTTRGRGSAIIASCAAAPSPPPGDCTTRAIATSSSPTATTSSRAFAPPPFFHAETKALS